jgi:hypothetical protein
MTATLLLNVIHIDPMKPFMVTREIPVLSLSGYIACSRERSSRVGPWRDLEC